MSKEITMAFVGNPNCGKTTLFNAFTGANLKVANWPGVTVERMEGAINDHGRKIRLVDLPGTYSLTSFTMEEQVSRQFILSDEVDVIVDVADASSLERSLFLTMQLAEFGKPMVLALNMMDIVEKRGIDLDVHRLSELLGFPVVPVTARKKKGLKALLHAALHQAETPNAINHVPMDIEEDVARPHVMVYDKKTEEEISQVESLLPKDTPNPRFVALSMLQGDPEMVEKYPNDLSGLTAGDESQRIINEKYDYIHKILREVMLGKENADAFTDKVDKAVTHPYLGLLIFFLIMACVFMLTFVIGDWLQGYIEVFIDWLIGVCEVALTSIGAAGWLQNLICSGIISGVGAVLTFLPNITILFIAMAFLEDSGYMARVAYIMNDIMGRLGLSGRAFIPMVLGFGCSVPAIMASRALETRKDKLRVMLITPFMSCSAKLPVYLLFAGMFFPRHAALAAYSMYLIGILAALGAASLFHLTDKNKEVQPLLIELPEYKWPSLYTVYVYVWDKVKDFLTKAGTTIFVASIIIWLLMNFGFQGMVDDVSQSFAAQIGRLIVPFLAPCGLGFWQIAVALISGLSAKEVVVSSTAVLFGIANVNSFAGMETLHTALLNIGFGPLNAYCMMLFCLLYVPCVAALSAIRKESGSWKFTWGAIAFQLGSAWLVSTLVFQIGSLFI